MIAPGGRTKRVPFKATLQAYANEPPRVGAATPSVSVMGVPARLLAGAPIMLAERTSPATLMNALACPTPPALSITDRVTRYSPPTVGVKLNAAPVVVPPVV